MVPKRWRRNWTHRTRLLHFHAKYKEKILADTTNQRKKIRKQKKKKRKSLGGLMIQQNLWSNLMEEFKGPRLQKLSPLQNEFSQVIYHTPPPRIYRAVGLSTIYIFLPCVNLLGLFSFTSDTRRLRVSLAYDLKTVWLICYIESFPFPGSSRFSELLLKLV